MKTRHGVAVAIAAALVATVSMAGCDDESDDPPDSGLPSRSELSEQTPTSPTTETTPSQREPELPQAATEHGRTGAQAFVRYYVSLENYASDTGDVALLDRYSHPQCGGCQDLVRFYREWYERGGWFRGGRRQILSFDRVFPAAEPHDMYVRISGHTTGSRYRERRGVPIQRAHGESFDLLLWLVWESHAWRVSRLDTP